MTDTPPPDLTHGLGPYLLTMAVAGVGAVWGMMRGKDAKLVSALEARIDEQKKQFEALEEAKEAVTTSLGKKLDEQREKFESELNDERKARIEDARRTASVLLRGYVGRGSSDRPTEWDEAPTGVRELLELVVPDAIDSRRDPSLPPPPKRPPRLPR